MFPFDAVLLAGPTASGKTSAALQLTESMPIEIISMDSALVYRGMDIGTAKPTSEELALAPHHLIDILEPEETFSAARFVEETERLIPEIHARGATCHCRRNHALCKSALRGFFHRSFLD